MIKTKLNNPKDKLVKELNEQKQKQERIRKAYINGSFTIEEYNNEREIVEDAINNELEKIKSITMEQFKSVARDVDEITDYYASKKKEFDVVIEEGDTVANDILFKVIGYNGRKLSLPIDISIIKEYCFSTELREEQFYDALMWITLRYVAISRCLSWNEWLKDYEKNKALENGSN